MLKVRIDSQSGFCGGVIRAIKTAERLLSEGDCKLFSLGAIVHNEKELARLEQKGLYAFSLDQLDSLPSDAKLLIRAHGVAPEVYSLLQSKGSEIIDCTCPVVLDIQKRIRQSSGQVLIYGKHGHPETLGLVGQIEGAMVFDSLEQLEVLLTQISPLKSLDVFSQTTMSPVSYEKACYLIQEKFPKATIHNTICRHLVYRHSQIAAFAAKHDVVIFVTGSHSSNGKVLSELCKACNPRTWKVSGPDQLRAEWFKPGDYVGVSGATSTPKWLLEEVATAIENLQ